MTLLTSLHNKHQDISCSQLLCNSFNFAISSLSNQPLFVESLKAKITFVSRQFGLFSATQHYTSPSIIPGCATAMPASIQSDALPLVTTPNEHPSSPGKIETHPDYKSLVSQNELPPSPAKSDTIMPEVTMDATDREQHRITRDLSRGAPGDASIFSATKSPEARELAKKRSQYYSDAFANREPIASARERVTKESMVMADVKTNVIVRSHVQICKVAPRIMLISYHFEDSRRIYIYNRSFLHSLHSLPTSRNLNSRHTLP